MKKIKLTSETKEKIILGIFVLVLILLAIPVFKNDPPPPQEITFNFSLPESIEEDRPLVIDSNIKVPEVKSRAATPRRCPVSLRAKNSENFDNAIELFWEQCNSENFQFYKLVRSVTNNNPSYPANPAQFSSSNKDVVNHIDRNVAGNTTYNYRLCVVERLQKITCSNVVRIES